MRPIVASLLQLKFSNKFGCVPVIVGLVGMLDSFSAFSKTPLPSTPMAPPLPIKNIPNDQPEEIPECLPLESPNSVAFEPGCFGWSEIHSAAVCVVGTENSDSGPPRHSSAQWRMLSLPEGLTLEGCEISKEGAFAPTSLVLAGKRLATTRKKLADAEVSPLPQNKYPLGPRNTLDLSYPSGRKVRLRWNQQLLETRDVGCGMVPVYRDRISVVCPKAIANAADDEPNVSIQTFPNAEAPPFPQKLKKREETLYLDEHPGEEAATVYSLSKGRYLLVVIEKRHGEPGLHQNFYTAALVDINRCRVMVPENATD